MALFLKIVYHYRMLDCCRIADNELHIAVKALPGASKTEITGVREGQLRVKIAAAPEDGKANAELIACIAKQTGCPRRDIHLLRGAKSRHKTIGLPLAYQPLLERIVEEGKTEKP